MSHVKCLRYFLYGNNHVLLGRFSSQDRAAKFASFLLNQHTEVTYEYRTTRKVLQVLDPIEAA